MRITPESLCGLVRILQKVNYPEVLGSISCDKLIAWRIKNGDLNKQEKSLLDGELEQFKQFLEWKKKLGAK